MNVNSLMFDWQPIFQCAQSTLVILLDWRKLISEVSEDKQKYWAQLYVWVVQWSWHYTEVLLLILHHLVLKAIELHTIISIILFWGPSWSLGASWWGLPALVFRWYSSLSSILPILSIEYYYLRNFWIIIDCIVGKIECRHLFWRGIPLSYR